MNRILFSLLYARGRRLLLRRLVLKNQCLLLKQQVCYLIDQTSKLKSNSANLMLSNIHFNIVILLRSLFFLWLLLVYCFFFGLLFSLVYYLHLYFVYFLPTEDLPNLTTMEGVWDKKMRDFIRNIQMSLLFKTFGGYKRTK